MSKLPAIHLDPAIPLTVPDDVIKRLRKNGHAHKYRAIKRNKEIISINAKIQDEKMRLPLIRVEHVDVIVCYERENWTCPVCFTRVDITKSGSHPDSPVCGHMVNFGHGGGHVAANIYPMHKRCNDQIANEKEKPRIGKVNRMRKKHSGIDRKGDPVQDKPKKQWGSRGWPPGRKLRSRNDLRKR